MEKPANGLKFLAELRRELGEKKPNFSDISTFLESKARKNGVPFSGIFELTPLCNLSCRMCYVHLMLDQLNGHHVLSVDTWKDLMYQAWKEGMVHATLTGGECLAYPGFDELFLYLHSLGCQVRVLTNGVLLDEKRIQFFLEHKPSEIQITLYGWNNDVYERVTGQRMFKTVSENIRMAVEAGLPVRVSVTPSVYLGEDVLQTLRVAKSLCSNLDYSPGLIAPRKETGRSEDQINPDLDLYIRTYRLFNELNGHEIRTISPELLPAPGGPSHTCTECGLNCAAGRSMFVINWKGILQGCIRLDMTQGYPLKDGFKAAWTYVNQWAVNFPKVPECEGCAYEAVCGRCVGDILLYAEPGKQPVEICERTMLLVSNGIRKIPDCD